MPWVLEKLEKLEAVGKSWTILKNRIFFCPEGVSFAVLTPIDILKLLFNDQYDKYITEVTLSECFNVIHWVALFINPNLNPDSSKETFILFDSR